MYKCFLDLDGVLSDFMLHCHAWHRLPYDYDKYPYPVGEWDCIPPQDMSLEDFWGALDIEYWATMPWTEDGMEILQLVEDTFGKENICILTSPSRNPECAAGKLLWIQNNIPAYRRRFLIGPPKHFCAGKDRFLVDDSDKNLREFNAWGGHGVCVPRKWNKEHACTEDTLGALRLNLMSCLKGF